MPFRKPQPPTELEETINELLIEMQKCQGDSDEFQTRLERLKTLYKLRDADRPQRISPDTVLIVAGNLTGIALILHYEKVNVVTSKALSFVMKLR